MNYSHLTSTQQFDALARLGRASQKFVKPEMLAVDYSNVAIELSWIAEMKGVPVMNFETLEIEEPEAFQVFCTVAVNPKNMVCTVVTKPIIDTEDKVVLALCKRYALNVSTAMDKTDLSPITRTKSKPDDLGNEEQ